MNPFRNNEPDLVQQRATARIKPLIPPDAEERVVRAVKQFNAIVREHIRSETGLRLTDEKGRGSVPVRVVDGFPAAVARLIDQHQDRTLWRLILALPKLGGVVEGLALLIENWDGFERWPLLPPVTGWTCSRRRRRRYAPSYESPAPLPPNEHRVCPCLRWRYLASAQQGGDRHVR